MYEKKYTKKMRLWTPWLAGFLVAACNVVEPGSQQAGPIGTHSSGAAAVASAVPPVAEAKTGEPATVAAPDSPAQSASGTIEHSAGGDTAAAAGSGSAAAAGGQSGGESAAVTTSSNAAESGAATPAELKLDRTFASAKRIVPFAFNRVGVGPTGTLAVKELVPLAKQAQKVYVRGRTDARGNVQANRKVALNRAYTVRTAFARSGVPSAKVRVSYCTACYIATNSTEQGRRANRRVDVEFIMPAEEIAALPKPVHAREYPETGPGPLALSAAIGVR